MNLFSNSCATARVRNLDGWRRRARFGAAILLVASALPKLFPSNAIGGSLLADATLRGAASAFELALAVSILLPRIGTVASKFALAVTGVFGLLMAYRLATAQPISCGCFGGWLAKAPWLHVLILSALGMLLLASLPTSKTRMETARG